MSFDRRNTPVSCESPEALALYEEALQRLQSYVGDALEAADRALALRPDFVLAHAFKAGVLMTFSERRFAEQARVSVEAAEALANRANERERGLTAAARHLVDGDWGAACAAYDRVLVDHPRDAFAIQMGHLFDFYRGDALNLRNRVSRVLGDWSPSVPGFSYVLGMHAFGLEECNQYTEAEEAARRALALEPKDAWAVHAAAHVMEMQGRVDEGIAWLEGREKDWAPDNAFAPHNYWHLALFYLDREAHVRALELYDRAIFPEPSDFSLQLLDATALLWRMSLSGVNVGTRFDVLAEAWEAKLEPERGFYAFNDAHAMMALAATGRQAAAGRLLADLERTATEDSMNGMMTRAVGLPVARAVLAFARGRYDDALNDLAQVRDRAHLFGGSHAQRDVLSLTLIEAALRANRPNVARHYAAERIAQKPGGALGWRLRARADALG
jgi:tetratricopeptide (TPR) repeat protein